MLPRGAHEGLVFRWIGAPGALAIEVPTKANFIQFCYALNINFTFVTSRHISSHIVTSSSIVIKFHLLLQYCYIIKTCHELSPIATKIAK